MIDLSQFDVSSPVSYLAAVIVPALDAILPVLPSETAAVALGVATAGRADPRDRGARYARGLRRLHR